MYVWRKLKRLGAIAQHDAAWILPATSRTREQFQWLASEIVEMKGEAAVWQAQPTTAAQDDAMRQRFIDHVDAEYRLILADLKGRRADAAALSRRFQQVQIKDHFQSELGARVRHALMSARIGGA